MEKIPCPCTSCQEIQECVIPCSQRRMWNYVQNQAELGFDLGSIYLDNCKVNESHDWEL